VVVLFKGGQISNTNVLILPLNLDSIFLELAVVNGTNSSVHESGDLQTQTRSGKRFWVHESHREFQPSDGQIDSFSSTLVVVNVEIFLPSIHHHTNTGFLNTG